MSSYLAERSRLLVEVPDPLAYAPATPLTQASKPPSVCDHSTWTRLTDRAPRSIASRMNSARFRDVEFGYMEPPVREALSEANFDLWMEACSRAEFGVSTFGQLRWSELRYGFDRHLLTELVIFGEMFRPP